MMRTLSTLACICALMLGCISHTNNAVGDTLWVKRGQPIMGEESLERLGLESALSSDGMTMVTSGSPEKVQVFDYDQSTNLWNQRGDDILETGNVVAMSGDGNSIVVGDDDDNAVYVYEWDESAWVVKGAPITGVGPNFGYALDMSLDGGMIAVGSYEHSDGKGGVQTFTWNGTAWEQIYSTIEGNAGDYCGAVVKLARGSKDALAVFCEGAVNEDWSGSLHLYRLNWAGNAWELKTQFDDIVGDQPGDYFGAELDMSDDGLRVAAGSYDHQNDEGRYGIVQIFSWIAQNPAGGFPRYVLHSEIRGGTEWVLGDTGLCMSGDGMTLVVANGAAPDNLGIYSLEDDDENPVWNLVAQINEPGDLQVDGRTWEGYAWGYGLACTNDGKTVVAGLKDKNSRIGTNDDVGMVEVFTLITRELSFYMDRRIISLQEQLSNIDPLGWGTVTEMVGWIYFNRNSYQDEHILEFDTWFRMAWGEYTQSTWETLAEAVDTFVDEHWMQGDLEDVNVLENGNLVLVD